METLNNNASEGGKEEVLQEFEAMAPAAKKDMVKALFTPEEAASLDNQDYEIMLSIAERYLERNPGNTPIEDALVVGALARTEALKVLGGKSFGTFFAQNHEGQVIASGSNETEAVKKGLDQIKE